MQFNDFYYIAPSGIYPNGEIVIKNNVRDYFCRVSYIIFDILNKRVNKYIPAVLSISPYYAEAMDIVTMDKNKENLSFVLALTTGVGQITLFLNAILYGAGSNNILDHDKAVTLIYTALYHELVHCDQNILAAENDMESLIAVEEEAEYRSYKSVYSGEFINELRIRIPEFKNFNLGSVIAERAKNLIAKYDRYTGYMSKYRFNKPEDAYSYIFTDILNEEINKHDNAIVLIMSNNETWRFDIKANGFYIKDSLDYLSYVLRNTLFKSIGIRSEFEANMITGTPIQYGLNFGCRMATNPYIFDNTEAIIYGIYKIEEKIEAYGDVYTEGEFPDFSVN